MLLYSFVTDNSTCMYLVYTDSEADMYMYMYVIDHPIENID